MRDYVTGSLVGGQAKASGIGPDLGSLYAERSRGVSSDPT